LGDARIFGFCQTIERELARQRIAADVAPFASGPVLAMKSRRISPERRVSLDIKQQIVNRKP
jgi:hypothetical protein